VKRRVFLKPPPGYEAEYPGSLWELDKVMYGLEEAMVEFDDFFESVVTMGDDECVRFKRLCSVLRSGT
jgi:hypothetical protein